MPLANVTRLLVATTNAGKLREIADVLGPLGIALVDLSSFPAVAEPEETGATFAENAAAKAIYYSQATGLLAVAEDSGLEIDALDGAPGVLSARYGGEQATYLEKFDLIYRELRRRGARTSPARFVCALALADRDRLLFTARGVVEGEIASEPHGSGGFGYDPIFYHPFYGRTLAEVTKEDKLAVSHRGQAFRQLRDWLADNS